MFNVNYLYQRFSDYAFRLTSVPQKVRSDLKNILILYDFNRTTLHYMFQIKNLGKIQMQEYQNSALLNIVYRVIYD